MRYVSFSLSAVILTGLASPVRADLDFKGMNYMSFDGANTLDSTASQNSLIQLQQLDVNTVALNVWDFTPSLTSTTIQPDFSRYSSTMTEVQSAINYIHSLGMNVELRPNLDVETNAFRGNINPPARAVNTWFANYQSYIDSWATLAQQNVNNGVTMFSVGAELSEMEQYSSNWTTLISSVRGIYSGKLTYAANWAGNSDGNGGYTGVSWWNQLDYIGIDAYFPLTNIADPTEAQLQTAWQGIANNLSSWQTSAGLTNEKILFTEAGYTAQPGSNEAPYAYDSSDTTQDIAEQANSYQALLSVMSPKPWWGGVFWWNWTQDPVSATDNTYTPENKPATLAVISSFYDVPEPSGAALLGVGSLVLMARIRPRGVSRV
jgi:hypothetical protein